MSLPMPDAALIEACRAQMMELAEGLPIGVLVVRDDCVVATNASARRLLGYDPSRAQGTLAGLFAEAPDLLPRAPGEHAACVLRRADGSTFRARVGVRAIELGGRSSQVVLVEDLSDRDAAEARLARQHDELQSMAHRLLRIQEDERRALSRELHDDVGQSITAIKLTAMALPDEPDAERRAALVAELAAIADHTIHKLRDLSLLLRPPQLDALGLESALRWQASALLRNGAPVLDLAVELPPARPPPAVELACFRIAQEALTNIVRHARARHVRVRVACEGDALHLRVDDDGIGIDPARPQGLGLLTMRERAQLVGGTLRIESTAQGTHLHACLPLHQP